MQIHSTVFYLIKHLILTYFGLNPVSWSTVAAAPPVSVSCPPAEPFALYHKPSKSVQWSISNLFNLSIMGRGVLDVYLVDNKGNRVKINETW